MRQGHQNRRGRGRNNNNNNNSQNQNQNRKSGQSPLTRSFESNGPDVKIRGTPSHIAEKYISLARDAKSSGDEVLAENYLQHAEHYNRIILAFREQQISQGGDPNMGQRFRVPQLQDPLDDEDFGEDGDDFGGDQPQVARGGEPQPAVPQHQPYEGGEPRERVDGRQDGRQDGRSDSRPDSRPDSRHEGREQNQQHQRGDRGDRGGQRYDDRQQRRPNDQFRHRDRDRDRDRDQRQSDFNRSPTADRPPPERPFPTEQPPGFVAERPAPVAPPPMSSEAGFDPVNGQRPRHDNPVPPRPDRDGAPRRRERYQPPAADQHEQPEFLRRPVRRPRREAAPEADGDAAGAPPAQAPVARDDGTPE